MLLAALCVACSPSGPDAGPRDADPSPTPTADYATVLAVPVPDYSRPVVRPPVRREYELRRAASGRLPTDAKAVGQVWIERLKGEDALAGYGLAGKADDGPVNMIDTLMTAREFDAWTKQNGWRAPAHIAWGFQSELVASEVSRAAAPAVRLWNASKTRTGMQLEALESGRIVMRDGCLWMQRPGEPDRIAWLHAETGLDRDSEGYLVLVRRETGEPVARVGEDMVWAGPNAVNAPAWRVRDIQQACGKGELYGVGNPESAERFRTRYPHTRPSVPPKPPQG